MRVHRVYIEGLQEGENRLLGDEAQHLIRVLRVKVGAHVQAFDGQGKQANGEVTAISKTDLTLELTTPYKSTNESALNVTLAVALLKGDKLSDVVRQATELGVNRIVLFKSQYADVPALSKSKLERLHKVLREAAKQSTRARIPELESGLSIHDLALSGLTIVAHPYAQKNLADLPTAQEVMIITGPEGGLSEDEVMMLQAQGATAIRFGSRILRAETAPIALLGALFLPRAL